MKHELAAVGLVTLLLAGALIAPSRIALSEGALNRLASENIPPVFQKGMSFASWSPDFDIANSNESLSLLRLTNTDWVAICVCWCQEYFTSTEIHPENNSPSNSSVAQIIEMCHELGMKVMLKPMVDPMDGSWRGTIPGSTAWFQSYANFINFWADFSQEYGVDLLCIGCEFSANDNDTAAWESIVAGVRARYTGPITYAANWTNYQEIEWWGELDYVGIDAYFPLTNETNPTVEDLENAWGQWANSMDAWQATVNKPVIFTEIGYRSQEGNNEVPWGYTSMPVDLQEQVNCYEATFQTFWNRSWFYGFYWWYWETDPNAGGENDTGYTPQNKPVQSLITNWYGEIRTIPEYPASVFVAVLVATSLFCLCCFSKTYVRRFLARARIEQKSNVKHNA